MFLCCDRFINKFYIRYCLCFMYSKVEDRRLDVYFKLYVIYGDCVCGVLYFIYVI